MTRPFARAGRQPTTDNLPNFYDQHPGQLGPKGLYDALVASTSTLQSFQAIYGAVKK